MIEPGKNNILYNTTISVDTSKKLTILGSVIGALFVYFGLGAVTPLNSIIRALIAGLVGYVLQKVRSSIFKKKRYSGIEFSQDYFQVHYVYRPKMKVRYTDVVEVRPAFESMRTMLVLTGDYPIFLFPLYDLEKNMHKKFVKFLEDRIAGL